jgi:hypothetical protein
MGEGQSLKRKNYNVWLLPKKIEAYGLPPS